MINIGEDSESILAVDVGAGTQDILLFNPAKEPENNIKLVLPSQTQVLARRISRAKGDLVMTGATMGGGPISMAILSHLKKGFRVFMTSSSAKTISDDLKEVEGEGIEIVSEEEAAELNLDKIETKDVDLDFILKLLSSLDEKTPQGVGIAVQDHGFEEDKSDRTFRFEKIRERFEAGASLADFMFEQPPRYYTRMNSVLHLARKSFDGRLSVIDSKFAAIAGTLHGFEQRPCICVDIGNGHTMAAVVGDEVEGVFEHHTHALSRKKLVNYIKRLGDGDLTNEEVFNDNGHGCYLRNPPGFKNVKSVLVTGPNRNVLRSSELKVEFVSPYGDVMMTGAVGIVDLMRLRHN